MSCSLGVVCFRRVWVGGVEGGGRSVAARATCRPLTRARAWLMLQVHRTGGLQGGAPQASLGTGGVGCSAVFKGVRGPQTRVEAPGQCKSHFSGRGTVNPYVRPLPLLVGHPMRQVHQLMDGCLLSINTMCLENQSVNMLW